MVDVNWDLVAKMAAGMGITVKEYARLAHYDYPADPKTEAPEDTFTKSIALKMSVSRHLVLKHGAINAGVSLQRFVDTLLGEALAARAPKVEEVKAPVAAPSRKSKKKR